MKRFSKSPTPGRSLTGCVESQSVSSAYYSIDYCREWPAFLPCWRMFELDLGQVYVSVPRLGKNWIDRLQVSSFLEPRGGRADPDTKPIQLGSDFEFKTSGAGSHGSSNPSVGCWTGVGLKVSIDVTIGTFPWFESVRGSPSLV